MGVVTQTIGSAGGRDFSTLQSWEDALPASLITNGNSYVGNVYNDSEFTSASNILTISGEKTDATHTITLQAGPGQSFRDNANVQTNRLAYVAANGVAIRVTGSYTTAVIVASDYVTFKGLQLKGDGVPTYILGVGGATPSNLVVEDCIFHGAGRANVNDIIVDIFGGSSNIIRNSLVIVATSNSCTGVGLGNGSYAVGVTVVRPFNFIASGKAFTSSYHTSIVRDCAIFGFTANATGTFDSDGHNACESGAGTIPGSTGNLTSVAYSTSTFVQPSAASNLEDFRLVTGAALVNAGVTDTTNIPSSDDIAGTVRPQGSAWDIGCWELVLFKPGFVQRQSIVGGKAMYIKNTSGQNLGFGLVNATTGAALTGATVTVYRSIDGGTQTSATGTVTDKGNGQYNLAMSQADTNGDEISFLFTATNAVPVEKTIVTQTSSSFIKSIQYGLLNIVSGTAYSASASISTVNTAKAQLVFLGSTAFASQANVGDIYLELTSSTQITGTRGYYGPGTSASASFAVVEYY